MHVVDIQGPEKSHLLWCLEYTAGLCIRALALEVVLFLKGATVAIDTDTECICSIPQLD
jgi:hypothetical protein